jgi:hypothetical protein
MPERPELVQTQFEFLVPNCVALKMFVSENRIAEQV